MLFATALTLLAGFAFAAPAHAPGDPPYELADLVPGAGSGYPVYLAALDGKLYFRAYDGTGFELWVYDPSQAVSVGTNPKELADINPGGSGSPVYLAALDGKLYFRAYDGTDSELWVYDPSQAVSVGTNPKELADLNPAGSGYPTHLAALDGKLYFRALDGTDFELWVYDPSQAVSVGTNPKELADINPGGSGSPVYLAALDGKLYFGASDGTDTELWVYDPSQAVSVGTNPKELADLLPGAGSGNPAYLTALDGKLYFNANDGTDIELWVYDPSQAVSVGTNPKELADLNPTGNGYPYSLAALDGKLYFGASDGTDTELWVYDPSQAVSVGTNPKKLADLVPGAGSGFPADLAALDGKLYFNAYDGTDVELWVYDPLTSVEETSAEESSAEEDSSQQFVFDANGGTFSYGGTIIVNLPANLLGESIDYASCTVSFDQYNVSNAEFGFENGEPVFDIHISCGDVAYTQLRAPLTVCLKPTDGSPGDKQMWHKHQGKAFEALSKVPGQSGWVCSTVDQLSLFTLGDVALPATGFAQGVVSSTNAAPANVLDATGGIVLDIPQLGLRTSIAGVPQTPGGWDVSWLGEQVGYLYGSAFPTWSGNTVLTGHVWDADDTAGIFYGIDQLQHGDRFYIHAWGQTFTYEVRDNYKTYESNLNPLNHSDYDMVTLLTCESFSEYTGEYRYRRAVTAVLVSVD